MNSELLSEKEMNGFRNKQREVGLKRSNFVVMIHFVVKKKLEDFGTWDSHQYRDTDLKHAHYVQYSLFTVLRTIYNCTAVLSRYKVYSSTVMIQGVQ